MGWNASNMFARGSHRCVSVRHRPIQKHLQKKIRRYEPSKMVLMGLVSMKSYMSCHETSPFRFGLIREKSWTCIQKKLIEIWHEVFKSSFDHIFALEGIDRNNIPQLLGYLESHVYWFPPTSRHKEKWWRGDVTHVKSPNSIRWHLGWVSLRHLSVS